MYSAQSIARYIIQRCNEQNTPISNLKLQKLLYFVQAEFLVARNRPCFAEEIEAWDFGPVVPEVYQEYKIFGGANIPVIGRMSRPVIISRDDQKLIDGIIDECAQYSASTLVDITHRQHPWKKAYIRGYNNVIPRRSIQRYFEEE